MRDEISRGLLYRLLNDDQINKVREYEDSLPPHESLASSQIMNLLAINPKPKVHESEKEAMQMCWNEFYKMVLGPLEVKEDKLHPILCCSGTEKKHKCMIFNCHHPWIEGVSSQARKMWRWEEYSRIHYKPPQIEGKSLDKTFGMVGSLILMCSGIFK